MNKYEKIVRPRLEYASSVWHWGLTIAQSQKIERQQKIACKNLRIDNNWGEKLDARRTKVCKKKYLDFEKDVNNVLNQFVCVRMSRTNNYRLRE